MNLRTGIPESEALSDENVLDHRKAQLWNEGVHFCWLMCNVDFAPGEDWSQFLAAYACGRHLSVGLLNGARVAYEIKRETLAKDSVPSQTDSAPVQPEKPPTYEQLDALSDESIAQEFRSVKRERAKQMGRTL